MGASYRVGVGGFGYGLLVATLVTFHAHPDDECIACGGVMRMAFEQGHRVVLVVATRGEHGEVPAGFLADGEQLWQRRIKETEAAAGILGAARLEFLGYVDSGMMGEPTNDEPGSFWTASVEEAAQRLAEILVDEQADVLTVYDDNGGYGHPDHIQVHRVGLRAAEIAGTPRVYQSTMNRDHTARLFKEFQGRAAELGIELPEPPEDGDQRFGSAEAELTARVDVSSYLEYKKSAMRAHASQISEDSFFLGVPDEVFGAMWGTEWFIRAGQGPGITETDLMTGL
jgi:LmbE family N-acetylglucosaminyl deacetylase